MIPLALSQCDGHERRARMPTHKFKLGLSVYLQSTMQNRASARGAYQVTKQLPERDGEFEYHIKHSGEPHERVARESELSK
jgi:hypothetical protein